MTRQAWRWVAVLGAAAWAAAAPEARASEAAATRADFRAIVRSAKDKVFPAVVYIRCLQETHEAGKKSSREVSGSGVIISPAGEVLTNWHVVDKAIEVRCLLFDGRAMEAEVVGSDKDVDLALVRLKVPAGGGPLPHAALGNSDALVEGDFVMAMGAPWGLSRSVSIGIVSCVRRYLPEAGEYSLWLQTDAAISPGNSGGPLVNTAGAVVGINTRAVMSGGDMGFAIPANIIRHLVEQIRASGKVNWSWTGLQLQALRDFDRNITFEGTEGVIVAETDPESPARKAGLQPRDRILAINGEAATALTVEDLPAIRRRLGLLPKHATAALTVRRDGQTRTVELVPREKGRVEGDERDFPRWDFTAKQINQFDNPDLYFHRKQGVFVFGIREPGNAERAGLRPKDIVLKVGETPVETLEALEVAHEAALANVEQTHKLLLTVLRNGLMRLVVLDFSRDYEKE